MPWNLAELARIYQLANDAGYRCAFFGETPPLEPYIYWRHDVDFCVDAARSVFAVEQNAGICSTWFFRHDAPFYNAHCEYSFTRFRHAGHRVGRHASTSMWGVYAAHKPRPEDLGGDDPMNAYADAYFRDCKYLSDSQHNFREGPLDAFLDPERFPRLQINLHPEWWAYEADTAAGAVDKWLAVNANLTRRLIYADQEL